MTIYPYKLCTFVYVILCMFNLFFKNNYKIWEKHADYRNLQIQQKTEKKYISSVPTFSEKSNRIADTLCFLSSGFIQNFNLFHDLFDEVFWYSFKTSRAFLVLWCFQFLFAFFNFLMLFNQFSIAFSSIMYNGLK